MLFNAKRTSTTSNPTSKNTHQTNAIPNKKTSHLFTLKHSPPSQSISDPPSDVIQQNPIHFNAQYQNSHNNTPYAPPSLPLTCYAQISQLFFPPSSLKCQTRTALSRGTSSRSPHQSAEPVTFFRSNFRRSHRAMPTEASWALCEMSIGMGGSIEPI